MRFLSSSVALLAAILMASAPTAALAGQGADSTRLTMAVSDPSGARIADAAVVVSNQTDQRAAVTGADGVAIFRGLVVEPWTVEVARKDSSRGNVASSSRARRHGQPAFSPGHAPHGGRPQPDRRDPHPAQQFRRLGPPRRATIVRNTAHARVLMGRFLQRSY